MYILCREFLQQRVAGAVLCSVQGVYRVFAQCDLTQLDAEIWIDIHAHYKTIVKELHFYLSVFFFLSGKDIQLIQISAIVKL